MKTIQKSLYLLIMTCFLIVAGCSSDENKGPEITEPEPLTTEETHQIVSTIVDIIRNSGRNFPQFEENQDRPITTNNLDDFLEGPNNYLETINEPGELKVRLWLDEEGNIIPSPTWQQNHPNYCAEEGRYMRSVKRLLEFQVIYDPELGLSYPNQFAYGVQLNLIEVESSNIQESVWVNPIIDEADNWIKATLTEAWNQMLSRTYIGDAVGPCKDEISLSLHFTSEFKRENLDPDGGWEWYDKVEGVIPLSFNSELGFFEGIGDINSVDGWLINGDYNPYQGNLEVYELITPLLAENGTDFPFMAMTITIADNPNTFAVNWLLCHGAANFEYGSPDNGYYTVIIDEWDEVDNPDVVLRKTFTLNDYPLPGSEYGDNNITEHTIIEIRKD